MSNRGRGLPSPAVGPQHLISTFGTVGVFAIIFAETGLLVGFFLPGDSLLFTAGLLSAPSVHRTVHLNLAVVLPGVFVAAVVGAQVGYLIGRRAGPAVFRRPESRLFKQEYVHRARVFFDDHGARTIVLARFIPVVRTFSNVMAGVARMDPRTFTTFNLAGGFVWSIGVTLAGYFLGRAVPNIDRYLLPIVAVIVVLSVVPVALEARRRTRTG